MKEIIKQIKQAGADNTRISPDPVDKTKTKIEIRTNNGWVTIKRGIPKGLAEDIIRQASSRVILG
jgi:hypothetical protein